MEFIGAAGDWEPEETSTMSLLLQKIRNKISDEKFSTNLGHFIVKDAGIVRDELRVVLLVESPHIHEVCYGYPLAGTTGYDVKDVLGSRAGKLLPNEPIERSVHENSTEVPRLGIMNVSQLPFQSKAYNPSLWWKEGEEDRQDTGENYLPACQALHPAETALSWNQLESSYRALLQDHKENWDNYIGCMEYIKLNPPGVRDYWGLRNNGGRRLTDEVNQLRDAIAKDLTRRLRCLHRRNSDVLLVRCGKIAQKFYDRTGIQMPNTCDLPHPTTHGKHKGWRKLKCEEERCLQNIVNRIWPPPAGA